MRNLWLSGVALLALGACQSPIVPAPDAPAVSQPYAIAESPMADAFGPLATLAGTRWRGEPGERDKENGQPADYSEWYWDLGGAVLVNRHVIEDGSYGGVTYVQKNNETGALDYVYITSAGFRTSGSFEIKEDGSWFVEEVLEGLEHIDKVRSTGRINPDGTMSSVSEFHGKDGWGPGHEFVYAPTDAPLPELVPTGVPE